MPVERYRVVVFFKSGEKARKYRNISGQTGIKKLEKWLSKFASNWKYINVYNPDKSFNKRVYNQ